MKVYIVTGEPFPNGMAATNRIKCYAKAILSQGVYCEVVVFRQTENPANPRNTVGLGMADDVIPFRYVLRSPVPSKNYFIRNIEGLTAKRRTVNYLKNNLHEGDVIMGYLGNHVDLMESLIDLAHAKGAAYCRDLCELPYGAGKETPKTVKQRQYMLERVFPRIDGFVAISVALYDLAKTHASDNSVVIKIPIMVDYEKYAIEDKSDKVAIPYIFHAGTITEKKDGFLGMLQAFAIARNKLSFPIQFIVAGSLDSSPDKEQIVSIINEYHLTDSVSFLGYLRAEEVLEPLSGASLVILNKYPNPQNQYGFSTKLGEYLAAGKPVILTRVGEAVNWLKDKETAYIIDYGDTEQLAHAIVNAFEHSEERKRIGRNARLLCQQAFDYKAYGKPLVEMFHQL